MTLNRGLALAIACGLSLCLGCSSSARGADARAPDPTALPSTTSTPSGGPDFGAIEPSYTGTGPKVAVLGDSIALSAADELRSTAPDHAFRIGAYKGEGLGGGPFSSDFGSEGMVEYATDFAEEQPEVAVIALGTNDAWSDELPLDAALAAADEIVGAFSGACIVTVTVGRMADVEGYDSTEAEAINARLREVADVVVERDDLAPGSVKPDGIHLTQRGQDSWAQLVSSAIRSCASG